MAIERVAESTDYWYFAVSGDPAGVVTAEVALLNAPPPAKPTTEWETAEEIVNNDTHPLWADALRSGAQTSLPAGQPFYFIAKLVGGFGGNTPVLVAGNTYTGWVRLTGVVEQPVLIAPVAAVIS